jgi:hypothetical protein
MALENGWKFATDLLQGGIFFAFIVSVFYFPTKEQRRWYEPKLLNPWRLALRKFDGIEAQDRPRLSRFGICHLIIAIFTALILAVQLARFLVVSGST